MKKIVCLLLALVMCLFLCACGGKSHTSDQNGATGIFAGDSIGGTGFHAGNQFLFQSGTGNTGLLEVDVSTDNLLIGVVIGESELLGDRSGLDGGGSDGGRSSVSHSSFPFWLCGL